MENIHIHISDKPYYVLIKSPENIISNLKADLRMLE